jgi:hypothetical protein
MSDRLALANAIEDAGIPRDKAQRVASVIFDAIHDNVATKADVQALGAELKAEITAQVGSVRSALAAETARLDTRIERLDAKVVLTGHRLLTQLGGLMVVLTGVLFAALHYWPPGHG